MKKQLKQTLSLLMSLVMIVSMFTGLEISSLAEDDILEYLSYEINNGEVTITDCDSSISGDIVIPDTIEGYPVTVIGEYAFYGCDSLTSVTIEKNATKIGFMSFSCCSNLVSVTIGENVKIIASEAFASCSALKTVSIPESVTIIEDSAFDYCSSLKSLTIPGFVSYIGCYAMGFKYVCVSNGNSASCYSIADENFVIYGIPNSASERYAKESGIRFESIIEESTNTPSDEKYLVVSDTCGTNLKWSLYSDGELVINGSGDDFKGHRPTLDPTWWYFRKDIVNVKIEHGITGIYTYSFRECSNITKIYIPSTIKYISVDAFWQCDSLDTIYYEGSEDEWNEIDGIHFINYADIVFNYEMPPVEESTTEEPTTEPTTKEPETEVTTTEPTTKEPTIRIPDTKHGLIFEVPETINNGDVFDVILYLYNNGKDTFNGIIDIIYDEEYLSLESCISDGPYHDKQFERNGSGKLFGAFSFDYQEIENKELVKIVNLTFKAKKYGDADLSIDVKNWYGAEIPEDISVKIPIQSSEKPTDKPTEKPTEAPTQKPVSDKLEVKDDTVKVDESSKISTVKIKSSAKDILKSVKNEKVEIVDKDGKAVSGDALVGTGAKIQIKDNSGKVISTYTVCVPTDVDGNGKTTAADARLALRGSAKLEKVEGVYASASDMNNDGKITAADARKILRISAGLEKV